MSASTIAAVRGAIVVPANTPLAIRAASARLLSALIERNALVPERVVSAVFTSTPDLTADFPAHAARLLGWTGVPLLGATEVAVPGAPARVIRVLLTVTGVTRAKPLEPVYLDGAEVLRPDLSVREAESRLRAGRRGGRATRATRRAPAAGSRDAEHEPAPHARRVAILGLGQIGGSIGLALGVAGGWHRVGYDANPRVRRAALATRAVDAVAPTLAEACAGAELVVIAVPVDALPRVVAAAAAALPRGAALLDTGSARRGVTEALAAAAARGVRAVGGHPIAGSEGRGLAAARASLFAGAPFVLLPIARGVPPVVRALVRALGAHARVVTPAAHDAALARTSHLPWVLACALRDLGRDEARRGLAGPGWRGMTRLAASDPRMAGAYARANRANVARAWRELRAAMDARVAALARRGAG